MMNCGTKSTHPKLNVLNVARSDVKSSAGRGISSALLLIELEQAPACPLTVQEKQHTTKLEEHIRLLNTDHKPNQWL
jgi:hypothetical protein